MQVRQFLEEQYRLVAHRAQVRPQNNSSGKDGTGAGDRQGELGGAGLAEVLKHMRWMERRLEAMEVHQQAIEGHQQAAAGRLETMEVHQQAIEVHQQAATGRLEAMETHGAAGANSRLLGWAQRRDRTAPLFFGN